MIYYIVECSFCFTEIFNINQISSINQYNSLYLIKLSLSETEKSKKSTKTQSLPLSTVNYQIKLKIENEQIFSSNSFSSSVKDENLNRLLSNCLINQVNCVKCNKNLGFKLITFNEDSKFLGENVFVFPSLVKFLSLKENLLEYVSLSSIFNDNSSYILNNNEEDVVFDKNNKSEVDEKNEDESKSKSLKDLIDLNISSLNCEVEDIQKLNNFLNVLEKEVDDLKGRIVK